MSTKTPDVQLSGTPKTSRMRIRSYPESLFAMWGVYLRLRPIRDALLRPFIWLLGAIGVTPNTLSFTGVIVMGGFAYLAPTQPLRALGLMAVAWLLDLADGAMARHLHMDGDRGKFTDMVCDTAVFALLMIGIVRSDLLHPILGMCLVYLMLLSKVMRCIQNALHMPSDWYFKAVAGFFPNSIVAVFYGLYLAAVLTGRNWLHWPAVVASATLAVDALIFHQRIALARRPAATAAPRSAPQTDG